MVKGTKHKCTSLFFLLVPWTTCLLCFSYESTEGERCFTDLPKVTYPGSIRIQVLLTPEDLGLFPLPHLLWALAVRDSSCWSWTRLLLRRGEKQLVREKHLQSRHYWFWSEIDPQGLIYSEWNVESWLPFPLLIWQLGIWDHLWAKTGSVWGLLTIEYLCCQNRKFPFSNVFLCLREPREHDTK